MPPFPPLFMRLNLLNNLAGISTLDGLSRVSAWSNQLLQRETVQKSVVEEFPMIYRGMLKMKAGIAGSKVED